MLTGDRVVLRPFRPEDREHVWRARLDPVTWAQTTAEPYVPETLKALRCYLAVGFVEKGRLREHAWVEGGYEDVVLMGLLRSER